MTIGATNLTWHAVDTKGYNVNLYHFAYALGRPTSDVLFWAVTIVNCLKKGPNIVRCAVINAGGATDFCARFLDGEEKPLKGFTLSVGETGKAVVQEEPGR